MTMAFYSIYLLSTTQHRHGLSPNHTVAIQMFLIEEAIGNDFEVILLLYYI